MATRMARHGRRRHLNIPGTLDSNGTFRKGCLEKYCGVKWREKKDVLMLSHYMNMMKPFLLKQER